MDSTTDADKKNMYFKIIVSCVIYFIEFDLQIFANVNSFEEFKCFWIRRGNYNFFFRPECFFFFKEKVKLCYSRLKELLTTNSSSDEVVRSATQVNL